MRLQRYGLTFKLTFVDWVMVYVDFYPTLLRWREQQKEIERMVYEDGRG